VSVEPRRHSLGQPPGEKTLDRHANAIGMDHLAEKQPQDLTGCKASCRTACPTTGGIRLKEAGSTCENGRLYAGKLATEPIDLLLNDIGTSLTAGLLLLGVCGNTFVSEAAASV